MITFKNFVLKIDFYFVDNSKIKRDHLFRNGLYLLESEKVILANNFIYYLNSIHSVNFDKNQWNLECRGKEEGGSNESLAKEISERDNINTNVLKNDFDLIYAKTLRLQYSSNPLIAYLNINPLQNNVDAIREITKNFLLHIFCIDETNLDNSFPDHHFQIDGYQFSPFRRDRNNFGRGKIVYIKGGLVYKIINDFETNISETISIELTISNKK